MPPQVPTETFAHRIKAAWRNQGKQIKKTTWCLLHMTVILFTFTLITFKDEKHYFSILLVTCIWILDTLPVAVTASLPLVLQPLLGIADCEHVAACFMSPRFLWLVSLHLVRSVVDVSALTQVAGGRIVELFGRSERRLLAVIVLFAFEVTLFVDEALPMLLFYPLVEEVVRQMQILHSSAHSSPTRGTPGTPTPGSGKRSPDEKLGMCMNGRPSFPETSQSYSISNLAPYIVSQLSSQGHTSTLTMKQSKGAGSQLPAAFLNSPPSPLSGDTYDDDQVKEDGGQTADQPRPVSAAISGAPVPSRFNGASESKTQEPGEEANLAVPINSSRMEAIFRMWDAKPPENVHGRHMDMRGTQPYLSYSDPEDTSVAGTFVPSATGLVPVLNPGMPTLAGEQAGLESPREQASTHTAVEELLTTINERLYRMKLGLKISIAYASTFGSFGTPYGTPLALATQTYFKDHLNESIGLWQWILLCLPNAVLTVCSCTVLVFWLFVGEWEMDVLGMELVSFLKNVVELKISDNKLREVLALMAVSVVIFVIGCCMGAVITLTDIEATQINCTACVLILALSVSTLDLVRGAAGRGKGRKQVQRPGSAFGTRPLVHDMNSGSPRLQTGLLTAPWGMLFLLGGHDCLGMAAQSSGVVESMHSFLRHLSSSKPIIVQAVLVACTSLLSEVWSTAEAHNALLVVVTDLAAEMHVNPVYYTFPVTIAISTAGVLPGSALAITLLMEDTQLGTAKLLAVGITGKLVAVVGTLVSMNTVATVLYDFSNTTYPAAADDILRQPRFLAQSPL